MATPVPGTATQTPATGGTPIDAIPANQAGGFIVNPLTAADQGVATAEPLYVNQVSPATVQANITTIALEPGQMYAIIPNATTAVSVAAASPSHNFTAVCWPTP